MKMAIFRLFSEKIGSTAVKVVINDDHQKYSHATSFITFWKLPQFLNHFIDV